MLILSVLISFHINPFSFILRLQLSGDIKGTDPRIGRWLNNDVLLCEVSLVCMDERGGQG